jgi:hypothetical protein
VLVDGGQGHDEAELGVAAAAGAEERAAASQ